MNSIYNSHTIRANPTTNCPISILNQQVALKVRYLRFDNRYTDGIIEINKLIAKDVKAFFEQALTINFPIANVTPASNKKYKWNDDALMADNVSSGFNYRLINGTNTPSLHGKGLAFDINPMQNPYIRYVGNKIIVAPNGATWNPNAPGTLSSNHPLVLFMTSLGWEWGGAWQALSGRIDYQHFQINYDT